MISWIPCDQELLDAARLGDRLAWDELHTRHSRMVLRTARRYLQEPEDAKDVAQVVWIQFFERVAVDPRIKSAASLLRTITIRRCIEVIRRSYRSKSRLAYSLDTHVPFEYGFGGFGDSGVARVASKDPGALDSLIAREEQALIEAALDQLPSHYQAVVRSRVYEDLTGRETALGLVRSGLINDTGNIEKRAENYYYRALAHLRSTLEPEFLVQ